ncbi:RNA-binding protein 25-like [Mytilus edulis]|uniref:RNA-binding protein 25-like n=1 Tax=Mytilus edulis TaxID=6550 RepID=UPI0039EE701B
MKPTLRPISSNINVSPLTDDDSNLPPDETSQDTKLSFSALKLGATSPTEGSTNKRKKLTVSDVFNQDDEDSADGAKKRKLVPLDYDDDKNDKKAAASAEEKRAKIKHLIENIPTAKEELFSYPLDWTIVDQSLMDKRIKPWVNKKIIEYIGEEEPTLTDFICQKVMARSTPQSILNDVAMVLDEEAEVFIVKMWRLLVYETEAKKLGLVK